MRAGGPRSNLLRVVLDVAEKVRAGGSPMYQPAVLFQPAELKGHVSGVSHRPAATGFISM